MTDDITPRKDIEIRSSAIIGVNPGYDSDNFTIKSPLDAARIVDSTIKSTGIVGIVNPALVLYSRDAGCPQGGEPTGIVFLSSADTKTSLISIDSVRKKLQQSTVSLITHDDTGIQMSGFKVSLGKRNLVAVAKKWHEVSSDIEKRHDFHLSGAVHQDSRGVVFAQGEANPTRITDLSEWEKVAHMVLEELQPAEDPVFRTVGYHYLRD